MRLPLINSKIFAIALLLIFFSKSQLWANCYDQAHTSLETNGVEKMDVTCFTQFLQDSDVSRLALGKEAGELIYGQGKYLFARIYSDVEEKNVYLQNSGPQTALKDIHFVEFDRQNEMVLVIANHQRDILNFRIEHGNIAPDGKINEPEFGADAVALERSTNQLMILDGQSREVVFYHRLAHPEGRHAHTKHQRLRTLDGAQMGLDQPLDLTSSKQREEFFVYDQQQGGQILVYPATLNQGQAPLRTLDVSHLGPFSRIDFNESEQSLELMNAQGEVSVISPE